MKTLTASIQVLLDELASASRVHEDRTDSRFFEIRAFVENGEFSQAKTEIEKVFSEGFFDIKLMMYLFFIVVMEKGIREMGNVFDSLPLITKDHWDQIYPLKNREGQWKSSLKWFLSSVVKVLKRAEKKIKEGGTHPFWEKSIKDSSVEEIDEILMKSLNMERFLEEEWPHFSITKDYFPYLITWLKECKKVVEKASTSPLEEEVFEEEKEEGVSPKREKILPSSTKKNLLNEENPLNSPLMELFLLKLEAFEKLLAREEFLKAAIIADDISYVIKNFDPTAYFPKLFSNYFALQAKHTLALNEQWADKESLEWSALLQLYRVDLNRFKDEI